MRTKTLTLLALLTFSTGIVAAAPLGTAFTYQGRLTDGTNVASGSYDLTFTLYDDADGGSAVSGPLTKSPVGVSNGLFAVMLDFGSGVFTGAERWLEIGVRTNGSPGDFTLLTPRQPLTAAPYALYSPSAGAAETAAIATTVESEAVGTAALQPGAVDSSKIADGAVATTDLSPTVLSNTFWRLAGNTGTTPGTHFLGTADDQPLEIRVNGLRALRLEPHDTSPNVIGGHSGNSAGAGVYGTTIGGGGSAGSRNNSIGEDSKYATIAGGEANDIGPNSASSAVGGGNDNDIAAYSFSATIAGGSVNDIGTNSPGSVIGGGYNNDIADNSSYATIAGGTINDIGVDSDFGAIGGGYDNNIAHYSIHATIAGGGYNDIGTNSPKSVIGGGYHNNIADNSTYATISGGMSNSIKWQAAWSTIGGGRLNTIASNSWYATIAGGANNDIGVDASYSSIGGGRDNTIASNSPLATIAGGWDNGIGVNADTSTIGGGLDNYIADNSPYATIVGGHGNAISLNSRNSAIGGGLVNGIAPESWLATIAGGWANRIGLNADYGAVGGGVANSIASNSVAATIAAGYANDIGVDSHYSTIGGGYDNNIASNAQYAVIPGGHLNAVGAGATNALAAGFRAKANHGGAFVWGDSTDADFASTASNQFNVRAAGGVRLVTGGAGINLDGSPLVSGGVIQGNGSGLTSVDADLLDGLNSTAFATASHAHAGADITSGTVADARLSSNIARLNTSPTFTGSVTAGGDLAGDRLNVGTGHSLSGSWGTIPGGLNNSATSYAFAAGRRAKANHTGAFVWADSTDADYASTGDDQFCVRASGGLHLSADTSLHCGSALRQMVNLYGTSYGLGVQNSTFYSRSADRFCWYRNGSHTNAAVNPGAGGTNLMTLDGGGSLFTAGGMYPSSDRNVKKDFAAVEPREVLAQLVAVPIQTWSYKSEGAIRHIGPVAQDFQAVFGLGADDKHIATVDADGVALAAIQGLNQRLSEELKHRDAENAQLKLRLEKIEELLGQRAAGGQ